MICLRASTCEKIIPFNIIVMYCLIKLLYKDEKEEWRKNKIK